MPSSKMWLLFYVTCMTVSLTVQCFDFPPPCNTTACNNAGCLCCGTTPPNSWKSTDVPQMVLLTIAGSMNVATYNIYQSVLDGLVNPNNCPSGATFFVQHEYTDYSTVASVYNKGHDLGVVSISGVPVSDPNDYNATYKDIVGMRDFLHTYGLVPPSDIMGYRAPWYSFGGDVVLQVLEDAKLNYDSSMFNRDYHNPIWPYSLDYESASCAGLSFWPESSYPGNWEFPLTDFIDGNDHLCLALEGCIYNNSIPDASTLLTTNYNFHSASSAPFVIGATAGWLSTGNNCQQLKSFLQNLLKSGNVYMVTLNEALKWLQQPTQLKDIKNFEPWLCNSRNPIDCSAATQCQCVLEDGSARQFTFCGATSCPQGYPWIGGSYRGSCKHFFS